MLSRSFTWQDSGKKSQLWFQKGSTSSSGDILATSTLKRLILWRIWQQRLSILKLKVLGMLLANAKSAQEEFPMKTTLYASHAPLTTSSMIIHKIANLVHQTHTIGWTAKVNKCA